MYVCKKYVRTKNMFAQNKIWHTAFVGKPRYPDADI